MPSKSEYKTTFNEILGTDIDWSKLSKEELAQLMVIFAHPEILAHKLGLELTVSKPTTMLRKEFIKGLTGTFKEVIEAYDGPLISRIREAAEKNIKKA